ncbi:hypothetical protein C1637_18190 [Chryseobacterium lactis]|uniref:Lipoprotein n=1 Tax=Chryseobacterium lactis TaxID=1241981 RepID=A0A3G6RJU3_CHRLC|nr:hypothetical protein [Chryseobacterium lactis]AZA84716.1 hypothetical protein EG342_23700 [Chryseobacterium lactis]AZB05105.1 hypothetical protein EG341_14580 [Chryseobacterium lactis]PNW12087.1 hypothetical protein C1637_18190 [Chryseobacterium lactis]
MFHKIFILSLGIFALTGCDAQKKVKTDKNTPPGSANTTMTKPKDQKAGIIYLNEGENKFLKEYQMNVTFTGISEDSRCPEGANCIWAGVALAQVQVMGTATRPITLNLASMDHPARDYHQSADFNGYTITLQDVTPYPKTDGGASALTGKYKIGITIKKEEKPSGSTTK